MGPSLLTIFTLATASTVSAQTYVSSFTQYGSNDTFGSGNCATKTIACGFFDSPGFNAAVSQNLYGTGPGAGAGPACGGCWQLTPETDSTGKPIQGASPIVVKVNNLCPAQGNPLCAMSGSLPGGMSTSTVSSMMGGPTSASAMSGMSGMRRMGTSGKGGTKRVKRDGQQGGATNSLGANVHFDLCIDGGAAGALFGSSGTGLAKGHATRVDCSMWKGGQDQH
jgi:hypothetical protein